MGYEGDTCSFTCNTGYELTGSDTRTCQSDGSWSGNDVICRELGTTPSPVSSDPQGNNLLYNLGNSNCMGRKYVTQFSERNFYFVLLI